MRLRLDVSPGELIDRITILELKSERLPEVHRVHALADLARARRIGERALACTPRLQELTQRLRSVNRQLWDAEEALRDCELKQEFGDGFVELARTVYLANDRRAALKSKIDALFDAGIREFKSYALPEA